MMKHYRIMLWGYGGESAYIGLTKEQYEYWSKVREGDGGEYEIIEYMTDAESWVQENPLPEEVDFLMWKSDDESYYSNWYDASSEWVHQYGVSADCRISVDEMESEEYSAKHIRTVVDAVDVSVINEQQEYDLVHCSELSADEPPEYVCQFWSAEKGTFFDGVVSIEGEFDVSKLKLWTEEYPNGDDVVVSVSYDGVDIENYGAETNGKGYSVNFWVN